MHADEMVDVRYVPAGAKAVHIGTLVFTRDGRHVTGLRVRDDFAAAMRDVAGLGVAGLSPRDVVKTLAVPLADRKETRR